MGTRDVGASDEHTWDPPVRIETPGQRVQTPPSGTGQMWAVRPKSGGPTHLQAIPSGHHHRPKLHHSGPGEISPSHGQPESSRPHSSLLRPSRSSVRSSPVTSVPAGLSGVGKLTPRGSVALPEQVQVPKSLVNLQSTDRESREVPRQDRDGPSNNRQRSVTGFFATALRPWFRAQPMAFLGRERLEMP